MHRIKVQLLYHTPIQVLGEAVSIPYNTEKFRTDTEAALNCVKKICLTSTKKTERHESLLEHAVFTWKIENSSRGELQEHMRHRISSSTVRSTRFTLYKILGINKQDPEINQKLESTYLTPCSESDKESVDKHPIWEFFVQPNISSFLRMNYSDSSSTENQVIEPVNITKEQIDGMLKLSDRYYNYLYNLHILYINAIRSILSCITDNTTEQDNLKYFLPEAFRTSFIWTINLRSLLNFLALRTDKKAHYEIRYIAELMKHILLEETDYKNLIL